MDALEAMVDLLRFAEAFDLLFRCASVELGVTECSSCQMRLSDVLPRY